MITLDTTGLLYSHCAILLLCVLLLQSHHFYFFFFNDTATTEIYTLSLHDALPICEATAEHVPGQDVLRRRCEPVAQGRDRKSTRLNSSHQIISYAVFCLKKKKKKELLVFMTEQCHFVPEIRQSRLDLLSTEVYTIS